jgi:flagellar protein FliS
MNQDMLSKQYKSQVMANMTQGELLVMLFEGLEKSLKKSKVALDNNLYDVFDSEVQRAMRILNYLMKILDMKYPISHNLFKVYSQFNQQLAYALAGRKKEPIDKILPDITDYKNVWAAAQKKAKR